MKKKQQQHDKGFAMLFTVLIISIILAIALGISDLTFKQTILSNLAKDSQIAFFQADTGVECGMYYNITAGQFPNRQMTVDQAPQILTCGNATVSLNTQQSTIDYFTYNQNQSDGTLPCFSVTFDNTDPIKSVISSHGFSTCQNTARQVERALMVRY